MKGSLRFRSRAGAASAVVVSAWIRVAMAQAQSTPAAPSTAAPKWYDKVQIQAFVDAYSTWNFNFPKPQFGTDIGRVFDVSNGFALNWAGVNVGYAPDPAGSPVGGFVALRFGPGAYVYNGLTLPSGQPTPSTEINIGAGDIKEAYASWKPCSKFQIDFGKFSTWIGAEVADSQLNINYTRSFLYFTQPFFHAGFRVDFPVSNKLDLKLYAVNGWNNTFDNNLAKTFGATANFIPNKDMSFYVNWIGGPEYADVTTTTTTNPATLVTTTTVTTVPGADSAWRNLFDAIADMHLGQVHAIVNADYGIDKAPGAHSSSNWFGGNLTVGYSLNDLFAVAIRGEYLDDPDGYLAPGFGAPAGAQASIFEATLTLAATPTPNLIIKLEPRLDAVSSDGAGFGETSGFPKGAPSAGQAQDFAKTQFTTTLGVVATTN